MVTSEYQKITLQQQTSCTNNLFFLRPAHVLKSYTFGDKLALCAGAAGGERNPRTPNGQKGGLGAHVRGAKAFDRGDRFFACEFCVFF